jgi:cyclase
MRPSLVLFGLLPALTGGQPEQSFTLGHVSVTPLGNDVYAAIRTEPLGMAVNGNSLFIVNDDHVVVVDAQFTREATLENLAALRRITKKPVRYVINTHWHDDHVAGNQVYQDSCPGVRFIAHRNTHEDLIAKGRPNRDGQVRFAPPVASRIEQLMKLGLNADSQPASPKEIESLTSAVKIIRQYVAENSTYREVLPDSLVDDRLVLNGGGRTIEVRWFGRANTRGDVVTILPRERIIASGDLLVSPMPFAFGSYPTEWVAVLDSVAALQPKLIVPGHGQVMRDVSYLRRVQHMITVARDSTRVAVAHGLTQDSALARVQLVGLRQEVAGDDKWMQWGFGYFFRRPIVMRAFEEAKNGSLK